MSLNKAFYGVKIGINGAGRIGRLACRACLDAGMIVSAFNDPFCSVDYLAYLLKHDSTHGKLDHTVVADKDAIVIDGNRAVVFAEREPSNIPWGNAGVELVLECTGVFTTKEGASKHIHDTVKKVIISAPSKDAPMFVWGVNQDKYDAKTMDVISNASCTTNCLAPLVKVIDAKWGLHQGLMTTIHAVTNTQPTVDGMSKKDWRGGRSALCNIIPASTGAAVAVGHVLPEVAGKLTGMAFRVPTVDVSVVDLTAELIKPIEGGVEEIKATFKEAADTYLNGILSFTDEDVVSTDFLSTTYTCNFDAKATILLNPTFAKFVAWYDNERGYATKLVRLAAYVAAMMQEE